MSSDSGDSDQILDVDTGRLHYPPRNSSVGTSVDGKGFGPSWKYHKSPGVDPQMKMPWVPAPAKTSSQTNVIYSRKTRYSLPAAKPTESRSEMRISDMPVPTPQTSASSMSDSGFIMPKPSKKSSSNNMSEHKLQSKDSFVDVVSEVFNLQTACLSRKRNRIMKLWEESISSTDTELLEHLESANKYGQEAAIQLEKLKSVSDDINKGYATEAESVESLRELVMGSLKKFEDENKVIQRLISRVPMQGEQQMVSVECSPGAGDRSSNVDLSLLNQMYSEKFTLTNNYMQQQQQQHLKSVEETKRLEDKIAEQQHTIKSLETELKRVESQYAFDFRLLKSDLHEKLDDLNGFPEILHVTEMNLAQCLSRNAVLEKTLQDKENENGQLLVDVNLNRGKVESLTEKIRSVEYENAQMKGRIKELEEFTLNFRQGANTENILKTIETKLEFLKTDTAATKIEDLEEKLKVAKRHIQTQKKAKEDVTNRLTRRVEELMEALDESRQKNHILRNQLRLIRSSYHKLFPTTEVFGLIEEQHPVEDGKDLPTD